jgi:uncharacterized protein (DUF1697 family)
MADLREILAGLGYTDVRTHLQSGNAVFDCPEHRAAAVERSIEAALDRRYGRRIGVIVRNRDELASIIANNTLPTVNPSRLMVIFFRDPYDLSALVRLDPAEFAPERYAAGDREIYLWLPDGVADSRLAKALTQTRPVQDATMRNWNTVTRLRSLLDA